MTSIRLLAVRESKGNGVAVDHRSTAETMAACHPEAIATSEINLPKNIAALAPSLISCVRECSMRRVQSSFVHLRTPTSWRGGGDQKGSRTRFENSVQRPAGYGVS